MSAVTHVFGSGAGLATLLLAALTACKADDPAVSAAPSASEMLPPAATATSQAGCGDGGKLQTELYGAIAGRITWDSDELECTGMPRPEGRGARLRFAGPLDAGDRQLALIIAIPDLQRGRTGDEFESNVTLIEEGGGRFFSTATLGNCLTNITAVEAVDDSGDRYAITGSVFCVSPLAEVNGSSSVSIPELHFSGLLDWSAS